METSQSIRNIAQLGKCQSIFPFAKKSICSPIKTLCGVYHSAARSNRALSVIGFVHSVTSQPARFRLWFALAQLRDIVVLFLVASDGAMTSQFRSMGNLPAFQPLTLSGFGALRANKSLKIAGKKHRLGRSLRYRPLSRRYV